MSDTPTNESLHPNGSGRKSWTHLVFFLGFLVGFLVSLVLNDRIGRKEPKGVLDPVSKGAHEVVDEHAEEVRSPQSHEAESQAPSADVVIKGDGTAADPQHDMEITKSMRDRMLTIDIIDLLQDAELHRYRFEGETKGVKLTKIRTGSIYEKAGFKDGDIVEQINGIAVADLEKKSSKMRQDLPSANRVEFKVRRGEKVITIRVRVAGSQAE